MRDGVAPFGCDLDQRCQYEPAVAKCRMGNTQVRRCPYTARPADDVEVEHPVAPAPSAAATVRTFDRFQMSQQGGRHQVRFDEECRIAVAAPAGTNWHGGVDT